MVKLYRKREANRRLGYNRSMGMGKRIGYGLVYSSDLGKMCPSCGVPIGECVCRSVQSSAPAGDGFVRVGRETKGRKGAGVTVVLGAPGDLTSLCTRLKKRCGSGGTVKDGSIEIQGDHRDAIVAELTKDGLRVKRVGG